MFAGQSDVIIRRDVTSGVHPPNAPCMLRLATPIFGISNISNFNHYNMPHFLKDACYTYGSLYQMFVQ